MYSLFDLWKSFKDQIKIDWRSRPKHKSPTLK